MEDNFIHTSPFNGIKVESWFEDMNDRALLNLAPFLKQIVVKRVEDIRTLLKHFRGKIEASLNAGTKVPPFSSQDLTDK